MELYLGRPGSMYLLLEFTVLILMRRRHRLEGWPLARSRCGRPSRRAQERAPQGRGRYDSNLGNALLVDLTQGLT
jgi:hypothetical protein